MPRYILFMCVVAALIVSPWNVRAQNNDELYPVMVKGQLWLGTAAELEVKGDVRGALERYRDALDIFKSLQQAAPKYQKTYVEGRIRQASEGIARIEKAGVGANPGARGNGEQPGIPAAPEDSGVLPPLPPDEGVDNGFSAEIAPRAMVAGPRASVVKPAFRMDPNVDPVEQIKKHMAKLEGEASEALAKLAEQQQANSKLREELKAAMEAQSAMEAEVKKESGLRQIYEDRVLGVKQEMDNDKAIIKQLRTELAEAKSAASQAQANLAAAEERINQLMSRNKVVAKRASEKGSAKEVDDKLKSAEAKKKPEKGESKEPAPDPAKSGEPTGDESRETSIPPDNHGTETASGGAGETDGTGSGADASAAEAGNATVDRPRKDAMAHTTRGIEAVKGGSLQEALTELEKAVSVDPSYAEAWINLAIAHSLQKPVDKKEGRTAYEKAVALGASKDPKLEAKLK